MYNDWVDAVADGETKLGFADWCVIQRQVEGEKLDLTDYPIHDHVMGFDDD
jgi:hypothetical protein